MSAKKKRKINENETLEKNNGAVILVEKEDNLVMEYQVTDYEKLKRDYPAGDDEGTNFFKSEENDTLNYLKIHPNGWVNSSGTDYTGNLSVYLHCGIIREELQDKKCKLEILNDNNEVLFSKSSIYSIPKESTRYGFHKGFKSTQLPNKRFKIRFTVFKTKQIMLPNFSLANATKHVEVFNSGILTDVTFEVSYENNTTTFEAHRVFLLAVSPVFHSLFTGPWKDKNEPIKINNLQPEVFKIFLRLLYGDTIEFDDNFTTIAMHLLSLASKYGMKEMGKSLVECMEYNLTAETAVDALRCADMYQQEYVDFKPGVLKYIKNNLKDVVTSDGYKALVVDANGVHLISEMMMSVVGVPITNSDPDGASLNSSSSSSSSSS